MYTTYVINSDYRKQNNLLFNKNTLDIEQVVLYITLYGYLSSYMTYFCTVTILGWGDHEIVIEDVCK